MKKLIKGILNLTVLIGLLAGCIFYFTKNMTEIADAFFVYVKDQNIDAAYDLCSDQFKGQVSKDSLKSYIDTLSLGNFKEVSWTSRQISLDHVKLEGVIISENSDRMPISMYFVKAGDKWKIQYIHPTPAGVNSEKVSLKAPSEEETVRLVNKSIEVFAQSIGDKNMAGFYNHISELFRRQTTIEKLNEAFSPFFTINSISESLEVSTPVFTEKPSLDKYGDYQVKGYYPLTINQRLNFDLKFIREGLSWKIIRFSVKLK